MKVQLVLNGAVIATQIVSTELLSVKPSMSDLKRMALRGALEDRTIR